MPRTLPRAAGPLAVIVATVASPAPGAAQENDRTPPEAETLAARRIAANTLLSLAIPGAGQLREGRDRGWAYLAAEVAGWAVWLERRHRGNELRRRYRDLAWNQGRIRTGVRVDGDFSYYETLSTWARSGAFDAAPAPGVQPETDPSTYNGSIWALAEGLFLPAEGDPSSAAYRDALDYYRTRAYDDAFLWDWSGGPEAQAELKNLIGESDDRFRDATVVLGLVLANHLVSAVDAYLFTSLDRHPPTLRLHPASTGGRGGWTLSLRIGALP